MTSRDICQTYELDRGDFYRCLQIRFFFFTQIRTHDTVEPSKIIQLFIDAYNSKNSKGIVGKLYKGFTLMNKNSTNYIRERWEKELNMVIAEEVWAHAWVTRSTILIHYFGEISVGKL